MRARSPTKQGPSLRTSVHRGGPGFVRDPALISGGPSGQVTDEVWLLAFYPASFDQLNVKRTIGEVMKHGLVDANKHQATGYTKIVFLAKIFGGNKDLMQLAEDRIRFLPRKQFCIAS